MTKPILLLSVFLAAVAAEANRDPAAPAPPYQRAVLIRCEGIITPLLENFLYRKLAVAEKQGADLVIVEIDSPGGIVDSSFDIAHRLRDLDWAQTVAFVPREALSGAAIAALGCDRIIMHPNAVLGDAGPIMEDLGMFEHVPEKVLSDLSTKIRDLATAKRRPPALAEAMMNRNLPVYEARNRKTGERTFMSEPELKAAVNPADWERGPQVLESRAGQFLEVTGARAVELRLAEGTARDREELRTMLHLDEAPLALERSAVDTAVYILNWPFVTGLLFVIGMIALYVELSAPGISVGGLIALLCFSLFFWSRFLGGTAELLSVVLFLVGASFLALEIFVLPGFGVSGITGILLMLGGVLMALQGFAIPRTPHQFQTFGTSILVIACSLAVFVAAAAVISRYFGVIPVVNRLILRPAPMSVAVLEPVKEGDSKTMSGAGDILGVGDWGTTESPLLPAGKARFGRRLVDVIADGSFVERGRQVRIVEIQAHTVVVRDVDDA